MTANDEEEPTHGRISLRDTTTHSPQKSGSGGIYTNGRETGFNLGCSEQEYTALSRRLYPSLEQCKRHSAAFGIGIHAPKE